MLVNIGMPLYNTKPSFVVEAIDSIKNQTFTDWNLIIINDCSSNPETISLLKQLEKEPKITIINNKINIGIAPTRKRIIESLDSDCKFLAFLDSDDMMTPARLEIQVEHLNKNPSIDILGTQMAVYPSSGIFSERTKYWEGRFITSLPDVVDKEVVNSSYWFINNPSCMIRKKVLEAVEYPCSDHDPFGLADYEFWCKCFAAGFKIENLKECLTIYRLHENQISNSNQHELKQRKLKNIKNMYIHS
jgi:glycosyltransferase involved in cell wall biosynthesis